VHFTPEPTLRRRLISGVLAALVVAGVVAAAPASAAVADDTAGISGQPANEQGADDRTRFSYQAAPGQHIDDLYLVRNTGTTAQVMTVFATDAYNTDDGSYGLLDTADEPVDAGSWVSFPGGVPSMEVPIEPGATQLIPFSVDVPADASPGDHAAGIVISVVSPQGDILVDRRIATRLYVRVPGDLQASLTISSLSAEYQAQLNPFTGATTVTATITNNGNVALGGAIVAGVTTYFGISASGIVRAELAEMLPGSSRTVTIDVPGVAQLGYLSASLRIAPSVDAEALNPGPLREVSRDTSLFVMPWWLAAIAVIALAVWMFLRWRARRDEKNAAAWIEYTEAEARRKAEEEAAEKAAADLATAKTTARASSATKAPAKKTPTTKTPV
jgi:ADP-ribose pyrophosphatase YjhB (NUDIX family)